MKGTSRLAAHRGESDQPADCKLFVPRTRSQRKCTKYDWETARQMLASGVYAQKDIASRLGIPTQQLTNFVYREKRKRRNTMTDFYYALCDAFCALTVPQQLLVALAIVFIFSGILYCLLWAAKSGCIRLLERLRLSHLLVDPEDIYDPSWMNCEKWVSLR